MPLAVAKAWAMRTVFLIYMWRSAYDGACKGYVSVSGPYLTSIELPPAQIIQLLRGDLAACSGRGDLVCLLDEGGPDLALGFLAQLVVFDAEVDATLDRLVENGHPVRGQDHDALEILQLSQEDRDEGVVLEVVLGAGFEEDVRFVEEEDGLPASDEV